MVPIGEVDDVHALDEILGCRVRELPMSYLGTPFGASHNSLQFRILFWKNLSENLPGGKSCICLRGVG